MLKIYNSLTRQKEEFIPINPSQVGMYTCGPTVYDRKHIGNFRTYTLSDLLVRVLQYNGYKVSHIMNFTDVGHLTGDNEGDADTGEDRLEKAAKRERKTAWEVAKEYEKLFLDDFEKLGLLPPEKFVRATDHIKEQIELVQKLEEKGFTYKTQDGVYFDTQKYEQETGRKYGELSNLKEIKEGARVEANPEKKNPRDFALWKFSPKDEKRDMEWESPWGKGFPGWHIECSAMSMKYLGESFDIHVGGEDLRSTHHPNEIAQSEAVTNKTFAKYWVHGAFVLIDGGRMSTSLGNNYNLGDILEKGFDPKALRYLYLTAHYKDQINFTLDSLGASQTALERLRNQAQNLKEQATRTVLSQEKENQIEEYKNRFLEAVNDDLNTAQGLAVVWDMLKSNIPSQDKYDLLISFDEVLGLDLGVVQSVEVPQEVQKLVEEREEARRRGDFSKSDELREKILELGFIVQDSADGSKVSKSK